MHPCIQAKNNYPVCKQQRLPGGGRRKEAFSSQSICYVVQNKAKGIQPTDCGSAALCRSHPSQTTTADIKTKDEDNNTNTGVCRMTFLQTYVHRIEVEASRNNVRTSRYDSAPRYLRNKRNGREGCYDSGTAYADSELYGLEREVWL